MPIYEYQRATINKETIPDATQVAQSPVSRQGSNMYLQNTTSEIMNISNPATVEKDNVLLKGLL